MGKKLLVFLLSITAILTLTFGLTACENRGDSCEHDFETIVSAKAPTCLEIGNEEVQKCSKCSIYKIANDGEEFSSEGDALDAAVRPKTGHMYEVQQRQEPSCTGVGYEAHKKCKTCDKIVDNKDQPISLEDIKIIGKHYPQIQEDKNPTCTETGLIEHYKCGVCEKLFSDYDCTQELTEDSVIINARHDFTNGYFEYVAPTCLESGLKEAFRCSNCYKFFDDEFGSNEFEEGDRYIEALNHDLSDISVLVEADCEIDEVKRHACSRKNCDYYEDVVTEGSAIEHEFENGICKICECDEFALGLVIVESSYFGGYVIQGLGTWQTQDVLVFPNTYKGEPIVAVEFDNESLNGVKQVIIPENIKSIKFKCDSFNNTIKEVVIKSSEMAFEDYAFYGLNELDTITVPSNFEVKHIGSSAFANCTSLEEFTFDGDYQTVGNDAFYNCQSLVKVELAKTVTTIEAGAFNSCVGLTEIYIPSSVTMLGFYAFESCEALEKVIIDDVKDWVKIQVYGIEQANPLYYAHNLYKKTATGSEPYGDIVIDDSVIDQDYLDKFNYIRSRVFYGCHNIVKVVIPNGIEEIDISAFENCINLKEIEFCSNATNEHSLTQVSEYAFKGCTSLKKVTYSRSIARVGYEAFMGCESITDIYFCGDEDAWREAWLNTDFSDFSSNPMYAGNATLYLYYEGSFHSTEQSGVSIAPALVDGVRQPYALKKNVLAGFNANIDGLDYLTSIGEYAFYNAKGLKGYIELDGIAGMSNSDFPKNFKGVTYVAPYAFCGCENIERVKFGNYLEEIGEHAFESSGIVELIMLGTSTSVGYNILYNCEKVETLQLAFIGSNVNDYSSDSRLSYLFGSSDKVPSSLRLISVASGIYNDYSLEGARGLNAIYLPKDFFMSGRALGYNAKPLSSLTIYYEGTIEDWISNGGLGDEKLSSSITLYVKNGSNYELVDHLVIPESITNGVRDSIGLYTFANVTSITKVTVHANFKFDSSTKYVFKGCVNLSVVDNYTTTVLTAGSTSYYYIANYATTVNNGLTE